MFVITPKSDTNEWDPPSTSSKLTGTLSISGGIHSVACRMCDLPCGLHFSEIAASCHDEDAGSTMDLVSVYSSTLKSLTIWKLPAGSSLCRRYIFFSFCDWSAPHYCS